MTGLLRDIVARHVRERVAPYRPVSFEAIIGIADGPETDVARDERGLLVTAYAERLRRKLGARPRPRPHVRRRSRRRR